MKGWGKALLIIGIIVIVISVAMDTSVSTGSGRRVHNLGLMRDQSNFMTLGALMAGAGLLMIIFGNRGGTSTSATPPAPAFRATEEKDPFDELEEQRLQEQEGSASARKRYAISLGIERRGNQFWFGDFGSSDLEQVIRLAESRRETDEPSSDV